MKNVNEKEKDLAIITVIGKDRTGIVAHVSQALYEEAVNIEDISQTIMEGNFVMAMLVDIKSAKKDIKALRAALEKVGGKIGQQIQIQSEKIFESMHRV
jgi:ACT domain-containing protein